MEIDEKIVYWVELSDYDLGTADILIRPLNVEARYPFYKERINQTLSEDKCRDILAKTKELQQWIKQKL